MSTLRNFLVLGCALGFSIAAYAGDEQKSPILNGHTNTVATALSAEKIKPSEKININYATVEELRKVKGIGKKISQAIVDYRAKNGNFKSIENLMNIKCRGINKHWFEKVSSHLAI